MSFRNLELLSEARALGALNIRNPGLINRHKKASDMASYWLYILCSERNGTLYIGIKNNLLRRIFEHKQKTIEGFSKKYNVAKLVYAEEFYDVNDAIRQEKILKKWKRSWKIDLIEKDNPNWNELSVW